MDNAKEEIMLALPLLEQNDLNNIMKKMTALGVESFSDLSFLTESDLLGILKPIQARKLVSHFSSKGEKSFWCNMCLHLPCLRVICTCSVKVCIYFAYNEQEI